jgi:hypothetical protein
MDPQTLPEAQILPLSASCQRLVRDYRTLLLPVRPTGPSARRIARWIRLTRWIWALMEYRINHVARINHLSSGYLWLLLLVRSVVGVLGAGRRRR